ncbi:diguanylate cyclase domain-containing protein [Paenibacillus sp. GCM10027626]|uniref:diguanylate cyclase domain-containing protein n=1 Tax=Paenibacillus sp. GCM10027626 TaxID=3273411 RepID=UPI003644720F
MKIGEFAELNNVTAKMLRHYDEMGLLKPAEIDLCTGYRSYKQEQSHQLNWIIILKNLDFSLSEIKEVLNGPTEGKKIVDQLIRKRIEIISSLNEQTQKKIAIDQLIKILEKEGFHMEKQFDLLNIAQTSVHEIKKNIPNMEVFLESANSIAALCSEKDSISVFRFDISHFKQVNDEFGFDVGDSVIVACFQIIESNVKKHLSHAAIGRAHGDEFVVFAAAGVEEIEKTARSIIQDMGTYNFAKIGCNKEMGCYIGGLVSQQKSNTDIRRLIEDSIEAINHAREKGPNAIAIETIET